MSPPVRQLRACSHRHNSQPDDRAQQHDGQAGAAIAVNREARRDQQRDADGVDRVDRAVGTWRHDVVGLERASKERPVVTACVIVVDAQVAIGEHALCDDEVVRLVAAGVHRARRQPICGSAQDERRRNDDPSLRLRARRVFAREGAGQQPGPTPRRRPRPSTTIVQPGRPARTPAAPDRQATACRAAPAVSARVAASPRPMTDRRQDASARCRVRRWLESG